MKRLICAWFGHENVWVLDPLRPLPAHMVVCLRCRGRAYSRDTKEASA